MTQDIRYALMFLAEVSRESRMRPVAVKKVADNNQLSIKFLEQVVGKLRQAGILWAYRGRNGGYGLESRSLSLASVYQALGHKPQNLFCPFPNNCRGGVECVEKEIEAKLVGMANDNLSGLGVNSNTI